MKLYLIEISLIWLCCGGLYQLLLRREKFFHLNRLYLLLTFMMGLILPLLEWPELSAIAPTTDWLPIPEVWLQTITVFANEPAVVASNINNSSGLLPNLFLLISIGLSLRFGYQLYQLRQRIRQGRKEWKNGICWVHSADAHAPCSWMNYLFWSDTVSLNTPESQAIVAHEEAHIKQRHSWDVLLLEITGLFFWWHPLWYAYRKALTDLHEYLADQAALSSLPTREYGQLLLRQCLQPAPLALAQNFKSSHLKKRIFMMTKSPSHYTAALKYLLLLPLGMLLFFACEEAERDLNETASTVEQKELFFERLDTVTTFDPTTLSETVEVIKTKIFNEPEVMPVFGKCDVSNSELEDCSNQNLLTHVYTNVVYPETARIAGQEGIVVASITINADGSVSDAQLLDSKKANKYDALNQEALRVLRLLPEFTPGRHDGEAVNVRFVIPIKFKLE